MTDFDTSGAVNLRTPGAPLRPGCIQTTWEDIAALPYGLLAQGYIRAAFATFFEEEDERRSEMHGHVNRSIPAEEDYGFSDLAAPALEAMLKDCERAAEIIGGTLTAEDGGRLWEHRAAGFPGPYPLDDRLREALPRVRLHLAHDGLIYQRPATAK